MRRRELLGSAIGAMISWLYKPQEVNATPAKRLPFKETPRIPLKTPKNFTKDGERAIY